MPGYRGRFAPSPTGPLHLGSLFAAVLSFAHARHHNGEWLLRIENIDPPREAPGATDSILRCLEAHGLQWDALSFQNEHEFRYTQTLNSLIQQGAVYRCPCSRKTLAQTGRHGPDCPADASASDNFAFRFISRQLEYSWQDGFAGTMRCDIEQDFVVKRKDGLWAYQLAVVADDHAQGVTHVVRGSDLLSSTPMQLALYDALGWRPPAFCHFPVLSDGLQKLSKQNHAPAVEITDAANNLFTVASLLQLPTEGLKGITDVNELVARITSDLHLSPALGQLQIELPNT